MVEQAAAEASLPLFGRQRTKEEAFPFPLSVSVPFLLLRLYKY